ncbi:hypothetical protein I4U23_003731 [Adineta vaga]|nr:hypothetical protein I4U23_003731 [Adineta vaga]
MKIVYMPDVGFKINDQYEERTIKWNDQRKHIRKTVLKEYAYKKDDFKYDALDISGKRDIYSTDEVFFVLNYDVSSNALKEIEIHHGIDIEVNGVIIKFGDKMATVAEQLGIKPTVLDNGGTYLFPTLKMTISNSREMGDDNNSESDATDESQDICEETDGADTAYFYASSNIDHLLEDIDTKEDKDH